jgi:Tol biopolymer transport system component
VIVYQTSEPASLRVIGSDGSGDHEIGGDVPGEHLQPDWSPDGTRIVFTSRGSKDQLFEVDANGGAAKQLLECADPCFVNESPAYSPDGRKVAFVQMLGQGGTHPDDCGLWILDRATGKSRRLTRHATCQDREAYPRWSPDGSKLVFFREHYGANDATERTAVFTVSAQGGKARQLTPWEMIAGHPDWSPDGKLIVFSTYPLGFFPEATVSHIYTMRPDGTNRRQLTDYSSAEGRASHPRWLPDGTGIVYVLGQKGHRELWRMAPDGTERLRIKATGDSWHPAWQSRPRG